MFFFENKSYWKWCTTPARPQVELWQKKSSNSPFFITKKQQANSIGTIEHKKKVSERQGWTFPNSYCNQKP